MDVTQFVKFSAAHHEGGHERKDTKDIHESFGAIKVGEVFGFLVGDESIVKEFFFLAKNVLGGGQTSNDGGVFAIIIILAKE